MLKVIITSLILSTGNIYAQSRPDPAEWAKNTRNLRECYDVAEDVYSQTHRDNRYITCIQVFSGTFDRKYCPRITTIDYIKGPTKRKIALHVCMTHNNEPAHTYEPRQDDSQDDSQDSSTRIIFNSDNY